MKKFLITGGAGFFGGILKEKLIESGYFCVSIDLEKDNYSHQNCHSIVGDIRNTDTLTEIFSQYQFDAIFHCAAILAHDTNDKDFLWTSNVDGTRNIAECAKEYNVSHVIFTSSNCLWGTGFNRPVKENDEPHPIEIYGKSKLEGEKILLEYTDSFNAVIFRCPTIIEEGRLGLLAILFEFIDEGRRVWVVGGGENKYQFIYAQDLINAFVRALDYDRSDIFNIGSDNVKTFREVYDFVIKKAGTGARTVAIPRSITLFLMKIAHMLHLSPLGPYQYKMIAEDFEFDTSKIKNKLQWQPTITNEEMLWKAYEYYHKNRGEIENRTGVSAHKQAAKMGIIRLLKWMS